MAKLHFNPWTGIDEMKEGSGRIAPHTPGRAVRRGPEGGILWTPCADILESPEAIRIRVELAGLERDEVIVEARGQSIWVYGERRFNSEAPTCVYQALERSYGPFARRFPMPKGADRPGISAAFANGLLEIVIPKMRPKPQRRRIPIEAD